MSLQQNMQSEYSGYEFLALLYEENMSNYKDYEDHHLYWFLYDNYGRQWNDFKDAIGWRGSDPWWLTWFVDLFDFVPKDSLVESEDDLLSAEDIIVAVLVFIVVFLVVVLVILIN